MTLQPTCVYDIRDVACGSIPDADMTDAHSEPTDDSSGSPWKTVSSDGAGVFASLSAAAAADLHAAGGKVGASVFSGNSNTTSPASNSSESQPFPSPVLAESSLPAPASTAGGAAMQLNSGILNGVHIEQPVVSHHTTPSSPVRGMFEL